MYTHNHAEAYHFLQDGPMVQVTQDRLTGDPIAATMVRAESGKRLMQHYLDVTDPGLVVVELDVYWAHVAQHRSRPHDNESGQRVERILRPRRPRLGADQALRARITREGRRPDRRAGR